MIDFCFLQKQFVQSQCGGSSFSIPAFVI